MLQPKMTEVIWKDYMDRFMNKQDDWDHNMEAEAVESPCVNRDEVVHALKEMKTSSSSASMDLIAASGEVGKQVTDELCQST